MKYLGSLILLLLISNGYAQNNKEDLTNGGINILEFYIGNWISDTKDFQGKEGHFTYDLSWFDTQKRLTKMSITQEFSDGRSVLLWSGFKGWHPIEQKIYYDGYNTRGIFCHGEVKEVEGELITEYDGIAANGDITRVKDVFKKVNEQSFNSTTFIFKADKWIQVTHDAWTKS